MCVCIKFATLFLNSDERNSFMLYIVIYCYVVRLYLYWVICVSFCLLYFRFSLLLNYTILAPTLSCRCLYLNELYLPIIFRPNICTIIAIVAQSTVTRSICRPNVSRPTGLLSCAPFGLLLFCWMMMMMDEFTYCGVSPRTVRTDNSNRGSCRSQ